jgi:hypothetical protein
MLLLRRAPLRFRLVLVAAVLLTNGAVAAERLAPFSFSSQLAPDRSQALSAWVTPRLERNTASQSRLQARFGLELGLTPALEAFVGAEGTAISLPQNQTDADGQLLVWLQFAPLRSTAGLGLSGLVRSGIGLKAVDVEARVLADIAFGSLWVGLNSSIEQKLWYRFQPGIATRLEQSLAVRSAFANQFALGIEALARTAFARGSYQGTAYYVGPYFTFRHPAFWISAGFYAQVAADKASADKGNGEPLEFRDNERFVLRLIVGTTPLKNAPSR